jgi:A/G-specific adenine glycosylase
VREVALVALIAHRRGSVLLARRSGEGLFGGMWEPPMVEAEPGREAARALSRLLGQPGIELAYVAEHTHVLTHRKLRVRIATGAVRRPRLDAPEPYDGLGWHDPAPRSRGPYSTLCRRILDAWLGAPSSAITSRRA